MRSAISQLGWAPRRRNVFYELVEDDPADDGRSRARAVHLPVAVAT
jgi:hypothetical protein